MMNLNETELLKSLKIDCSKCFGFCCVALYFSKSDGFPVDKKAGTPCSHLKSDFKCKIHQDLRKNGLKGCTAYDCFGAGQKVAQVTYGGNDWCQSPQLSSQMYDVFLMMRQLHEMLWYLSDALNQIPMNSIKDDLKLMIKETEQLTNLDAEGILQIDIERHRMKVNVLLRQVNELVNKSVKTNKKINSKNKKSLKSRCQFISANLTKTDLIGANFAGALLIAANLRNTDLTGANLIGADLRDADIRGANLSKSLFLTQSQVNVAKGDSHTKLPQALDRPSYWD